MEAIDLPGKDVVTDDMPAWIESEFLADDLGNARKKLVLAGRSVFGHETRGVVPPKSQAEQLPAVAVDRKPPKQVSRRIYSEQGVGYPISPARCLSVVHLMNSFRSESPKPQI